MVEKKEISFNKIYESYVPLIKSTAQKMLSMHSIPDSEYDDLVQEGTIALYNAVSFFEEDRGVTFGLYAKICIKNRLVSYIRTRFGNALSNDDISIDEISDEESRDGTPEQIVLDKESVDGALKRISEMLTPYENSIFNLYMCGMSYGDISATVGKPIKSVDNAIRRVKDKLRKLY